MKAVERVRILLAGAVILVYGTCQQSAWADVYAYTTSAGIVNLSNVQMGNGYSIMLHEPVEQVAPEPAESIDLVRSESIAPVQVEKDVIVPGTYVGQHPLNITNKTFYDKMVNEAARIYGL